MAARAPITSFDLFTLLDTVRRCARETHAHLVDEDFAEALRSAYDIEHYGRELVEKLQSFWGYEK
jgi:hypothetical protein